MPFASVYPHYIQKAERKGRTKAEVDAIIHWLTGYDERTLQQQIDKKSDLETVSSGSKGSHFQRSGSGQLAS
jgi:hypothetical protein